MPGEAANTLAVTVAPTSEGPDHPIKEATMLGLMGVMAVTSANPP